MPSSLSDGPEGNYKRNVNDIFMLPPVLVQSGKSTFSFQHIALLDPYQQGEFSDLGEVSYSDNFGKTWKGVKWVNANSSPNFILGDLANSKFEEIAIDFSENIGDTILIRFRIETNNFREAEGWFIDDINMDDRAADVNESPEMYSTLAISPNPANTNSKLNIRIPVNALVGWEIFNSLGMKVGEQSPEFINEGNHSFNLDIANLTVGSYYIRVKINDSAKSILLNIIR